jgi:hypothetical protein
MDGGGETLCARAVATVSDLAFERVGGIVSMRLGQALVPFCSRLSKGRTSTCNRRLAGLAAADVRRSADEGAQSETERRRGLSAGLRGGRHPEGRSKRNTMLTTVQGSH